MNSSNIEDVLVDPNTTRSSLKKRLRHLIDNLWAGDPDTPPVEALALALGRDQSLQQQSQKLIQAATVLADELEEGRLERRRQNDNAFQGRIVLSISCGRHHNQAKKEEKTSPETAASIGSRNRHLLLSILTEELDIANKLTRLLELDAPPPKNKANTDKDKEAVVKSDMPNAEKTVEELPWNALWISAADIMLHILRNKGNLSAELYNDPKFVSDSKFLEACLRFVDGRRCMMTAVCMSYCVTMVFEHCKDKGLGNRFLFNNGVAVCAEYLHKDYGVKRFIHWYRSKKVHPWEERALYRRWWIYYSRDSGIRLEMFGWEKSVENTKDLLVHWGRVMSANCARSLAWLAEKGPESGRATMLKDKKLIKGMMFWFRSPLMVPGDMEMIGACTTLIGNLCVNETIALFFIKEHHILTLLEVLIFCPHYKNLIEYLKVVCRLASHQGVCRDYVSKSKIVVKALLSYCGSYEKEVAIQAVKAVTLLLTGQTAQAVLDCGFNIRQLIIWNDYSFYHDLCAEWGKMKTAVKASGVRDWLSQEARLKANKAMGTNNFDEGEASSRMERGNAAFKHQEYKKAISHYNDALKFCPPSKQAIPCVCLHYDNVGVCRGHTCNCTYELWTPLAAQLYIYRAECYLNLGKPKEAVENCDEAIARCLEDIVEAKELLLKSICHRAKAALELGDVKKALSDAGFYRIHEKGKDMKKDPDPSVTKLFDEIFFKYREVHGYHFIRRCFVCLKGEGEKLKRCANCEELYCSKECQMSDWQRRHKDACPGNKKKKTTEDVTELKTPNKGPITDALD